jgi:hypothetical protein
MNLRNVFKEVSSLKYIFDFYFLFFNVYKFFCLLLLKVIQNRINNQFDEHSNDQLFSFDLV